MIQAFATQLPSASATWFGQQGTLTSDTFQFIRALFQRTGGNSGISDTTGQNLSAAGTTQSTAITLSNDINEVNTVPANGGVTLSALQPGQQQFVFNTTGTNLKVYPALGMQIDSLGLNTPYSLAGHKAQVYTCTSQNQIRSLQLG